jgi:2',3'-cyclic-nucleotide 2'-phosphodiesterase (5'-nucleotidase family)
MTMGVLGLSILLMSGCTSTKTEEINVLATTDLHGEIPYDLSSYVKNEYKKDENTTLVDAGDFFSSDSYGTEMDKYFDERSKDFENNNKKHREVPIAKEMKEVGYDAVVLGNHEFINNDKFYLDNMVSDFKKQGIDVLSANTYEKNGENYVKPYTIKNIKTSEGNVKLGILGITIKEVGERKEWVGDKLVDAKSRELEDQAGFNGELYMNDLVKDADRWVNVMKKEEKPDVVIAVVHSGEKPKKPRNPGNRIQELAGQVDGIDAIVAGHTHKEIEQHDYKNKSGETVIVTQPGSHGECISKLNFQLEKNNDKWDVINKSSEITKFEKSSEDDNYGKLMCEIAMLDGKAKEVSLSQVAPFEWDKAYAFAPRTPVEKIYDTVGYKWRSITEAESDNMIQIVFMKDKKPVCYFYGNTDEMGISMKFDKSEYKDNIIIITAKDNDKFKVEKDDKPFVSHLNHI